MQRRGYRLSCKAPWNHCSRDSSLWGRFAISARHSSVTLESVSRSTPGACPFRDGPEPGALSIRCSECHRDVWSHGGKMYQCNICGKWNCQDDQFEHQAMCQTLEGESFKCVSCNKRGQWSCMRCKVSYCDTHVVSAINVDIVRALHRRKTATVSTNARSVSTS